MALCAAPAARNIDTTCRWTRCDASNNLIRRRYSYLTQWDQVFLERVRLLNADYAVAASRDFDARGRIVKQFVPYEDGQADEGSRRWTYDPLDRVVTDGLHTAGGAIERETSYAYNGLSSTATDPLSHATTQTLAAWGDLLSVTDARFGRHESPDTTRSASSSRRRMRPAMLWRP